MGLAIATPFWYEYSKLVDSICILLANYALSVAPHPCQYLILSFLTVLGIAYSCFSYACRYLYFYFQKGKFFEGKKLKNTELAQSNVNFPY